MYSAGRHERRRGEVRSTATQINGTGVVLEVNRERSVSKDKKKKSTQNLRCGRGTLKCEMQYSFFSCVCVFDYERGVGGERSSSQ